MFKKSSLSFIAFVLLLVAFATPGCASDTTEPNEDEPSSTPADEEEVGKSSDELKIIGKPCGPSKTWQCAPIPFFCVIVCRAHKVVGPG